MHFCCRAPYGARGLKLNLVKVVVMMVESRPVWGAWIEIADPLLVSAAYPSRPVWGAWIEMNNMLCNDEYAQSRPVWGAWIEIPSC